MVRRRPLPEAGVPGDAQEPQNQPRDSHPSDERGGSDKDTDMKGVEETREEKMARLLCEISESRRKIELYQKEYESRKARIAELEKEREALLKKLEEKTKNIR